MQHNLQNKNFKNTFNKIRLAFPLSLPIQKIYSFKFNQSNVNYAYINDTYWIKKENFHFISYIQIDVNQAYKLLLC